jgi:hypothetical protein
LEAGELRIRHAELAKLVAQAPVATKLSASLDSDQMSHDAYIDWTGYELSGATVYSKGAALTISANAAALLFMVSFSVWWIVSSSKLLPSAKLHQFGHWLAPAAIGAGMIVYFLVVPKISIPSLRTVHLSFHALRNDALNLAQSLGDAISNPGASTVVSNAAAHVHTFSPQELDSLLLTIVKDFPQDNHSWWMHRPHALTNLFTGEPIRFEASPGNMILRPAPPGHPLVSIVTLGPAPGLYELVWHDLDGAEALTNSVPPWPPR